MGEFNDFFDKEIESSEQIKECLKCQKEYDKKIKELEEYYGEKILELVDINYQVERDNNKLQVEIKELKQNQFEVIASGKVTEDLPKLDIYFIKGKQVNSMFKKYSGKNIILGVKVIGKV